MKSAWARCRSRRRPAGTSRSPKSPRTCRGRAGKVPQAEAPCRRRAAVAEMLGRLLTGDKGPEGSAGGGLGARGVVEDFEQDVEVVGGGFAQDLRVVEQQHVAEGR